MAWSCSPNPDALGRAEFSVTNSLEASVAGPPMLGLPLDGEERGASHRCQDPPASCRFCPQGEEPSPRPPPPPTCCLLGSQPGRADPSGRGPQDSAGWIWPSVASRLRVARLGDHDSNCGNFLGSRSFRTKERGPSGWQGDKPKWHLCPSVLFKMAY